MLACAHAAQSPGGFRLAARQATACHIVNQRPALLHSALVYHLFGGDTDWRAPTFEHINTSINFLTSPDSFICL